MTQSRYGIKYPNGDFTGGITTDHSLATAYAKQCKGMVYKVGSSDDPETSRITLK